MSDSNIQINEGFFRPIEVSVPPSSILNPDPGLPVSGGNVETSQRNADVLLKAFSRIRGAKVVAGSQGTMNNVMFGSKNWAFYETVGGGMGARQLSDGVDGIQCHMTNTLNTPVEELESAFPVQVTSYEFRADSCGLGKFRGGCGLVRSWKVAAFEEEGGITFTVVADRQIIPQWGIRGGEGGSVGSVWIRRHGQQEFVKLRSKDSVLLHQADEVQLHTPGGGGFGGPSRRSPSRWRRDVASGLVSARRFRILRR